MPRNAGIREKMALAREMTEVLPVTRKLSRSQTTPVGCKTAPRGMRGPGCGREVHGQIRSA